MFQPMSPSLIAQGRYGDALEVHRERNPFALTCGRICPAFCESKCRRGDIDEPVAIRMVKRFMGGHEMEKPWTPKKIEGPKTKKVAVVGAGPAGLTAALRLAQQGYPVTVFEKLPVAGGMMVVGIPEYRLPRHILNKEIENIKRAGVEIRLNQELGNDFTVDSLFDREGFGSVVLANPDLTLQAVRLRAFGQEIIRKLGGKRVHPNHSVPGGVNAPLSVKDRDEILGQIEDMTEIVKAALGVAKGWYEKNMDLAQNFAVFPSGYMGLVDGEGGLQLYEGQVRLVDRDGKKLEEFDPRNYLEHIGEHVEDWSYLKFPFYRKMGWPKGVYRVGPLGRLNVVDKINTPMANEELNQFKALGNGRPVEGTLWYHYARLIEDLYAIERAQEILLDPDVLSTDLMGDASGFVGEGVGCIEAPRGTLFHHYKTDANGMLTHVNLIVAPGHNNWAMNTAVEMVAKFHVDGKKLTEGMLNRVEAAIRAYDPCLSCSTHAIGAMPIVIEMISAEGVLLDRLAR